MKPAGIYKSFTHSAKDIPPPGPCLPNTHCAIVQSRVPLDDLFAIPM